MRRWDFKRRAARYGQCSKISTRINAWRHHYPASSLALDRRRPAVGHGCRPRLARERTCPPGFRALPAGFLRRNQYKPTERNFLPPWPNLNSRFALDGETMAVRAWLEGLLAPQRHSVAQRNITSYICVGVASVSFSCEMTHHVFDCIIGGRNLPPDGDNVFVLFARPLRSPTAMHCLYTACSHL